MFDPLVIHKFQFHPSENLNFFFVSDPLEEMPKSSHHAQVQESTPGRGKIHLPNPVFNDDDVSGLSSGHDLLHCDHLFALQSGLRIQHHGSGHVHYALLGKEH